MENNTMQPNQTTIKTLTTLVIDFAKKNWLLVSAFCLVIFFLFIIVLSFFLSTQPNKSSQKQTTPVAEKQTVENQPEADFENNWAPTVVSNDMYSDPSIKKEASSDGSIIYTYPSSNPNRDDMTIVKKNSVVFQRSIANLEITDYKTLYGTPEYTAVGSHFWGPDAITYFYYKRGIAFIGNPKTGEVFEQIDFMPVAPKDYKATYGEDLIGDLQKN